MKENKDVSFITATLLPNIYDNTAVIALIDVIIIASFPYLYMEYFFFFFNIYKPAFSTFSFRRAYS